MAARNPSPEGEFRPHKPRSPPFRKHCEGGQHQPGHKASPRDSIPTFETQTLAPGSAPADRTYTPQYTYTPAPSNIDPLSGTSSVATNMPGATSRDVYSGIGKPVQGMSSAEVHHDGKPGRKREQLGLVKHGVGGEAQVVWDRSDDERLEEGRKGSRGGAEDHPVKVLG